MILKEEEDEAFDMETSQNDTDNILNNQHNAAVRTIAIGHIVDKVTLFYINFIVYWFKRSIIIHVYAYMHAYMTTFKNYK